MKMKAIDMNKLYILSAVLLAASAQATDIFIDDFTGADGTVITNDGSWGYIDLGWQEMGGSWGTSSRTAPADRFEIQGNELYAEITPMESFDTTTLDQKVKAAIYPMVDGSQVSADIGAGEKAVFKADLTAIVNNLGHKWHLNHELKLILSESSNVFTDPDSTVDRNLHFKITARESDNSIQFAFQGADDRVVGSSNSERIETIQQGFTNNADLPIEVTIEHYSSGMTVFLYDDTVLGTVSGTAMTTLHPYIWVGNFSGDRGTNVTVGSTTIDNVAITIEDAGTAPDAAIDFAASVPVAGTIDLSWTDVATNELGYRLERQIGAAAYTNHAVLAANDTSYQDTGLLTDGTTYSYRLTAFNGVGDSAAVEASTTATVDTFGNWAANYLVLSGSKDNTVDYDKDGASDFREYALNGNPTNDTDTGMVEAINDGTTFSYIYAMRTDDNSLTYTLVDTVNLVDGPNATNNWDNQTSGSSGVANFDSVTNNYNMISNPLFIKLIIE